MKSCSDHVMRVPLQGCPMSECRLTCIRLQWVHWSNCALCPLLAVTCGDTGLALFTLTVSSPRMDYRRTSNPATTPGLREDIPACALQVCGLRYVSSFCRMTFWGRLQAAPHSYNVWFLVPWFRGVLVEVGASARGRGAFRREHYHALNKSFKSHLHSGSTLLNARLNYSPSLLPFRCQTTTE
jgi:hypothetical protein